MNAINNSKGILQPPRILWALVGELIGLGIIILYAELFRRGIWGGSTTSFTLPFLTPAIVSAFFFTYFNYQQSFVDRNPIAIFLMSGVGSVVGSYNSFIIMLVLSWTVFFVKSGPASPHGLLIHWFVWLLGGFAIALFFPNIKEQFIFHLAKISPMILFNMVTVLIFSLFLGPSTYPEFSVCLVTVLWVFLLSWLPYLLWRKLYGDWFSIKRLVIFSLSGMFLSIILPSFYQVDRSIFYSHSILFAVMIAAFSSGLSVIPNYQGGRGKSLWGRFSGKH